jgi:hypothetical protein|tara:strand:- start:336 stop:458 length:123 start_codon:yes stop_codon:yes gene_type:complete
MSAWEVALLVIAGTFACTALGGFVVLVVFLRKLWREGERG